LAAPAPPAGATALSYSFASEFGSSGTADGQFNGLYDVAVNSSGTVYGSDGGNHRIDVYDANGSPAGKFGSAGTGDGEFGTSGPFGITIAPDDTLYVADVSNQRVGHYQADGGFLGYLGSGNHQIGFATDVAVDASGNVYVAE